jgi:uncharacterized alkaline shock family protein YloU
MSHTDQRQPQDTVQVHPQVIRALVRAAALEVPGVARVGQSSSRWLTWDLREDGVRLEFEGDTLTVKLQIAVLLGQNMYHLSQQVQQAVSRTLQTYVGLSVKAVHIQIADVILGTT